MLIIREPQLDAFRVAAASRFERRVLAAVAHSFPREFASVGEPGMRLLVQEGRVRAARHGWRSEQAVYLFLMLMLMLGAGFDADPLLPWVKVELARQPEAPAMDRCFALHAAALAYLDLVAGEDNEHLVKALIRLRDFDLGACDALDATEFPPELGRSLILLYPQKAEPLGPQRLAALVQAASARALQHGFVAHGAVALVAA